MSMWHTVLQDASYKGVPFDVVSLDESDGKALALVEKLTCNLTMR